jgi:lysophospholipase L1-like esterase
VVNVALRLLPLRPDAVIVVHGVNDQKPNRYPGFRPDYSHWYERPPSDLQHLAHRLIDQSLLASHLRNRLEPILNPYAGENWRGEHLKRYDTVDGPGLVVYRRNLESIIAMCRMQKCRTIIGTEGQSLDENGDWNPSLGTPNPLIPYHECQTLEGIRDGFQKYNDVNREVAQEHGCPLVDLDKLLTKGKQYYQDDVHFTAAGSEKAAELFLARVPWETWLDEARVESSSAGEATSKSLAGSQGGHDDRHVEDPGGR